MEQSPYQETDISKMIILHFKLLNGEELISEVLGINKNNKMIVLNRPLLMTVVVDDGGAGMSFTFSRWQPMAKKGQCEINPNHIISQIDVYDELKLKYIEMCNSYSTHSISNEYNDNQELASPLISETPQQQESTNKNNVVIPFNKKLH